MPALRTRDTGARALQVTTDAPQPPMLTIVSPTPRAFTFPSSHNLNDSPCSTPSSSPFEPDLCSLPVPPVTPPPLMRTLTPETPASHRPNESSSSSVTSTSPSDVERRPKKGDEDYVKRPENAFILFRRKCAEERDAAAAASGDKKKRQADLSKAISQQWKSLSAEERKYWEDLAKEKKKEHARMFPNYVYRPQRVRDADGKVRNKKRVKKTEEACEDTNSPISFVIPTVNSRRNGRSASAPTPPPSFQTVQLPSVLLNNTSCPSSPSLVPILMGRDISQQDPIDNFDYRPNLLAPPIDFSQYTYPPLLDTTFSSAPSSPASGPFTPTSSYSYPSSIPSDFSPTFDGAQACNWQWPTDSEASSSPMLMNGDFDINSIQPIELGFSKEYPIQQFDSFTSEVGLYPLYNTQVQSEYGYESQQTQFFDDTEYSQFSMDHQSSPRQWHEP